MVHDHLNLPLLPFISNARWRKKPKHLKWTKIVRKVTKLYIKNYTKQFKASSSPYYSLFLLDYFQSEACTESVTSLSCIQSPVFEASGVALWTLASSRECGVQLESFEADPPLITHALVDIHLVTFSLVANVIVLPSKVRHLKDPSGWTLTS